MAVNFDAVPGLASFMESEETESTTTVKEGDGETITETSEQVDIADEGSELEAEGEKTDEQVEMICNGFNELDRLYTHISTFGVSREFLSWYGADKLAAMLNIQIPSMESIDRIGDPNSALSIACLEAIDGENNAAPDKKWYQKIWDFIKKVLGGIWAFMQKAFQFIINFVIGVKRNIGRLRTMYGERVDAPELAKQRQASFSTLTELQKVYASGGATMVDACLKVDNAFWGKLKGVFGGNNQDGSDAGIDKALLDQIGKFDNEADNINKILQGQSAKSESKKRPLADCAWTDIPKLLDFAEQIIVKAQAMQNSVKRIQTSTKDAVKMTDDMRKMAEKSNKPIFKQKGKTAAEAAKNMNKIAKSIIKVLNYQRKIATQAVKTSALRIVNGGKKK